MVQWWKSFVEKNPKLAQWIREGGLFVIVSNLITVFKAAILIFLPAAFAFMGSRDYGFPGTVFTLFGHEVKWYIIGYSEAAGGMAYFWAYMIAMVIGEAVNFPIQKVVVFQNREKGAALVKQIVVYIIAFCLITVIVNSINCIWKDAMQYVLPSWLLWAREIFTVVLNGGVSMVVFFFVNKWVFKNTETAAVEEKAE